MSDSERDAWARQARSWQRRMYQRAGRIDYRTAMHTQIAETLRDAAPEDWRMWNYSITPPAQSATGENMRPGDVITPHVRWYFSRNNNEDYDSDTVVWSNNDHVMTPPVICIDAGARLVLLRRHGGYLEVLRPAEGDRHAQVLHCCASASMHIDNGFEVVEAGAYRVQLLHAATLHVSVDNQRP